ncbi:MAG: type II toxin-antitoxin system RelE/ParE family toxin [Roseburia sp.]|nr:type II toxin-antitoxin system RelE/ParE family toxin [Roseburia sp.]MCM1279403.1 type II toxin-antitoxin system RelE/ParE family toxin [Robinsoniella sp.]
MKRYVVRMTAQAEEHVLKYAEYIKYELMNPQASVRFVNDIRAAVNRLEHMPKRNPLTDEEPWRSMDIRKMVVRGYIIYYWVEDLEEMVYVIGVVYAKREQAEILETMDLK